MITLLDKLTDMFNVKELGIGFVAGGFIGGFIGALAIDNVGMGVLVGVLIGPFIQGLFEGNETDHHAE